MTDDDKRAELYDLALEVVQAQRALIAKAHAVRTTDWVRAPEWRHKPSDDFNGCTE
jgi:hypothetical protein